MGKKIASLMAEQREKFLTRAVEQGYQRDFAVQLWGLIEPFAGYGFPKGTPRVRRRRLPDRLPQSQLPR